MKLKGSVFFKDQKSASIEKKVDGTYSLDYEKNTPAVSLTLPNSETSYQSEELFPFFDGLIPEGWLLNLVQKNWKIPKNDRMTLLLTTCQDCIGAVHVHAEEGTAKKKSDKAFTKKMKVKDFHSPQCLICMEELPKTEKLYHKKCAQNLFGFTHAPVINISTQDFEELALLQVNQRLTLTGVQKKLSLSDEHSGRQDRLTVVGHDERFILKPSSTDYPEMAQIEHLCMKMAEKQNIPVARCGLVYLVDGELAYITQRFDRVGNEKIQMEDFCQLSEKPTDKKYSGSSEGLGKIIDLYSDLPQDDKLTLFQVILFSFWIGNADMHLKNFSLWRQPSSGSIRYSPGYDFLSTRLLLSVTEDAEELALPVNGKKNKLTWSDFLALGRSYKIPEKVLERTRDQMLDTFLEMEDLIHRSFLTELLKEKFNDLLRERSERLSNLK